ncbi:MAG: ComF family protein [Candidatus Zixiibacteriota bacterium]
MSSLKIKGFLLGLKDDLLDFVYPQTCPICGRPLGRNEKDVCDDCWNVLAVLPAPFCPYCKSIFEDHETLTGHLCPHLRKPEDRKIIAVRSLGTFDDHYQKLIHRLKYDGKIPLGRRLGQRLGEKVAQEKEWLEFDFVIPVPLHRARRRERGFNQSEILSQGICQATEIPLLKDLLIRKKNTRDQTYLNAQQRSENVRGAFAVKQREKIGGKNIILVDDVTTTGATLNECARTVLEAGAENVFAATLAVVVE